MQEEDSVNQPFDSQLYYELEKHHSHTLKLLFGSLARGTQSERSDIDLIVVRQTNERFVERPTEILMMLYEKLRGWAIDVLVYTPEEYERMLAHGNFFLTRAVREGRIVYES